MMRFLKKSNPIIFVLILFGIVIFGYLYFTKWSTNAQSASMNAENSKRLTIGMNKTQVLNIMGVPNNKSIDKHQGNSSTDSLYYYKPPFGASDGIYIHFNVSGIIEKITPYE